MYSPNLRIQHATLSDGRDMAHHLKMHQHQFYFSTLRLSKINNYVYQKKKKNIQQKNINKFFFKF